MPERAVVYTRVSTRGQEDRYSLPEQRDMCASHCAERGYSITETLVDVYPGDELEERPQMGRLLGMLAHNEVDVVVAIDLDRLSRDQVQFVVIVHEVRQAGARIELLDKTVDPDSPMDWMQFSLMAGFAQIERLKIRQRSLNGKRQRAKQGKLIPAAVPLYGYRYADSQRTRYEPHPVTAPIAVRIFTDIAGGKTMGRVCQELMREGIPSPTDQWLLDSGKLPRGGKWRRGTLNTMLKNPTYIGEVRAFRHDKTRKRRDVDPVTGERTTHRISAIRPDEHTILVPNGAPALVSIELQQAALARLAANKVEAARNYQGPITAVLRAGYVRCGNCGSPMHVRRSTHSRESERYFCPSQRWGETERCATPRALVADLDAKVWAVVAQRIGDPRFILDAANRREQDDGQTERILADLDRQARDAAAQRDSLASAVAMTRGDDSVRATLIAKMYQLDEEERGINANRDRIRAIVRDREAMRSRREQFVAWCESAAPALDGATYEQKRLVLYALNAQVWVVGGNIHDLQWDYEDTLGYVEDGAIVSEPSRRRARGRSPRS